MSRFTQSQLTAYTKEWTPLFYTQQPLMRYLKARGRVKRSMGGEYITKQYENNDIQLKSFGRYEQHIASESGDPVLATWRMGALYADDQLSGLEKEFNAGAEGKLDSGKVRDIRIEAVKNLQSKFGKLFRTRLWNAAGASLNGGGGVEFLGITQAISQTPSSGTYAGVSRVTHSDWRNIQVTGTSGPSASFASDAWERVLTATTQAEGPIEDPMGVQSPDLLFCTKANKVIVQNKAYSQNTNLGGEVRAIQVLNGMELNIDEDVGSGLIYGLNSATWEFLTSPMRDPGTFGVKMHYKKDLPDQVHEEDEALVMSCVGLLRCTFPKRNFVITSAS